jgi:6,7-dimethyl-8-ribityllumazine synthase
MFTWMKNLPLRKIKSFYHMSSKDQNLSAKSLASNVKLENAKVGIVVSDWNQEITHKLLDGAIQTLVKAGVDQEKIKTIHVPGAFELPTGAKMLLQSDKYEGIICLGCVIKGETKHDEYINNAVANGIMQLSLISGKPVIFGVLTPNDMQQAIDRAGGKHGNKGDEAATTLIEMIELNRSLLTPKKGIGY